jgi:hypothetical protein
LQLHNLNPKISGRMFRNLAKDKLSPNREAVQHLFRAQDRITGSCLRLGVPLRREVTVTVSPDTLLHR